MRTKESATDRGRKVGLTRLGPAVIANRYAGKLSQFQSGVPVLCKRHGFHLDWRVRKTAKSSRLICKKCNIEDCNSAYEERCVVRDQQPRVRKPYAGTPLQAERGRKSGARFNDPAVRAKCIEAIRDAAAERMAAKIAKGLKKCSICRVEKTFDCFKKHAAGGIGLNSRCRECDSAIRRASHDPELTRIAKWRCSFGIQPSDFEYLVEAQDNKCAICRQSPPFSGGNKTLVIDHAHGHLHLRRRQRGCKECIRGLLCDWCNLGLGFLEKSPCLQNELVRTYLSQRPLKGK